MKITNIDGKYLQSPLPPLLCPPPPPSLSWGIMLNVIKIDHDLIPDHDMFALFE